MDRLLDVESRGEPWGRRLWLATALVGLLTVGLGSYGISTWPMADDEVPSLIEMGLRHVDGTETFYSVPFSQIAKISKVMPVWYSTQRWAIELLPASEVSYRLPSLFFGVLVSLFAFVVAARWRGLWFAAAVTVVLLGSQLFLLLIQVDRFYSLPLLLLSITLALVWARGGGVGRSIAVVALTALTVLSHSLTVPVFGLLFGATVVTFAFGRASREVVLRSAVALLTSAAIYLLYLRPLLRGWSSTGNPTPVLISFAAYAEVPTLALALLGGWLALLRRDDQPSMLAWALMAVGSVALFLLAELGMNWNPRYFLFYLPAVWLLAAHGMEYVARSLRSKAAAAGWYAAVVVLLLPGIASHFRDGSRHDYRSAAAVLSQTALPGQLILSDDAETISYYLPPELRRHLVVRTKVQEVPATEFFLVCRSNVWTPLPEIPHRRMELLAEISRRRFDEFSHVVRVYRVPAARDNDTLAP